jgi:hypothetical protein
MRSCLLLSYHCILILRSSLTAVGLSLGGWGTTFPLGHGWLPRFWRGAWHGCWCAQVYCKCFIHASILLLWVDIMMILILSSSHTALWLIVHKLLLLGERTSLGAIRCRNVQRAVGYLCGVNVLLVCWLHIWTTIAYHERTFLWIERSLTAFISHSVLLVLI